jgi:hypothetical protein
MIVRVTKLREKFGRSVCTWYSGGTFLTGELVVLFLPFLLIE